MGVDTNEESNEALGKFNNKVIAIIMMMCLNKFAQLSFVSFTGLSFHSEGSKKITRQ